MRPAPEPTQEPTSLAEAQHARKTSEAGLAAARARDPAVRRVAGSLRELRRENHFADLIGTVFREHRT